jgi:hypothetical protein
MSFAGVVASTSDLGHVLGDVIDADNLQAGLGKKSLIFAGWDEQVVVDRRPGRDLVAVENTGHGCRVGEQQPTTGPEQASPLREDTRAVRKVVDGIDAKNGVEGRILKRQWPSRVGAPEGHARVEGRLGGHPVRDREGILADVDADDLAARRSGDVQRWPARAAPDVEDPR